MQEGGMKQILLEKRFIFNKSLGQNFIYDTNLLKAIASDAKIDSDDTVLEIGAGAGTLTRILATLAKNVIAYEIDRNLATILESTLADINNVKVIFSDFLKSDLEYLKNLRGVKVVANLPYYITTPIIMKLLEEHYHSIKSINVMVQKEVAERICANAGSKDYGAISCSVQARADVSIMRIVSRNMFHPAPNVDSAILSIIPNPDKYGDKVDDSLFKLIKTAFAMRRKTLLNNLIKEYKLERNILENILIKCNINTNARGETLNVEDFINLNGILKEYL